ncbi:MAG: hypothetical protein JST54_26020 [Deltaproteobacteria bacterium]|nr:hypothetical protein [Deltaproteobacteria bacterium]
MDPSLKPLLDRSFHRAAAREANAAIQDARERAGAEEPFSYELVVEGEPSLADLAANILPRLVYHLESRGARAPEFEGLFLSLFVGEDLVFVHARDAMPMLAQAVGLSLEELAERYGTGELRRALRPGEVPPAPHGGPREKLLLTDKPKA